MGRSSDRPRGALAALWPRWFWRGGSESRQTLTPLDLDYLDEYLQLLDDLDDLCQDDGIARIELSSEYLSAIAAGRAEDLIRRHHVRFAARGLRITFSPGVPRDRVILHTRRP